MPTHLCASLVHRLSTDSFLLCQVKHGTGSAMWVGVNIFHHQRTAGFGHFHPSYPFLPTLNHHGRRFITAWSPFAQFRLTRFSAPPSGLGDPARGPRSGTPCGRFLVASPICPDGSTGPCERTEEPLGAEGLRSVRSLEFQRAQAPFLEGSMLFEPPAFSFVGGKLFDCFGSFFCFLPPFFFLHGSWKWWPDASNLPAHSHFDRTRLFHICTF